MDALLLKKARKKYLSLSLAKDLVKIKTSPLNKAYALTFGCSDLLAIGDTGELTSSYYCKKRWCQTCASINMATLINKYIDAMQGLDELNFITLTIPNCSAENIAETLELMGATWRRITDTARKLKMPFKGLRKIELKAGKYYGYHPHYHIIMENNKSALWLRDQWLKRLPQCSIKAQDVRPIENVEAALIELMKYATKLTCAEGSGNDVLCSPRQMDVIFCALAGRRLYQTFGGLKSVNEDEYVLSPEVYQRAAGFYQWIGHDWFHTKYGHALSGYVPEGSEV